MAILLAGCASARVSGGAYINETKRFTARLPSDAWRVEAGKSPDLLLRHRSRQAGMSIHATCGRVPASRSVEVVGRHLFFGIERKDVLEQERWPTAGGEGLELLVRGELDGREFLLHSYTLKDPGCVYDLVLFADSEDYAAVNQDFEAFVHGFRRLPERQCVARPEKGREFGPAAPLSSPMPLEPACVSPRPHAGGSCPLRS